MSLAIYNGVLVLVLEFEGDSALINWGGPVWVSLFDLELTTKQTQQSA